MVFNNLCVLVFWTKVASALEGLRTWLQTTICGGTGKHKLVHFNQRSIIMNHGTYIMCFRPLLYGILSHFLNRNQASLPLTSRHRSHQPRPSDDLRARLLEPSSSHAGTKGCIVLASRVSGCLFEHPNP